MPPCTPKKNGSIEPFQAMNSADQRDITWDRPVFRPPVLQNPRIIFDPLPFTAQRLTTALRQIIRP
jgi:hypothetical protein